MSFVAAALAAHRWITAAIGMLALVAGSLVWGPLGGMWVAVLIVGLLCLSVGATLQEFDAGHRANAILTGVLTGQEARTVKLSGIMYISAAMFGAYFGAVVLALGLIVSLIDFAIGHHVVRTILQ